MIVLSECERKLRSFLSYFFEGTIMGGIIINRPVLNHPVVSQRNNVFILYIPFLIYFIIKIWYFRTFF